MPELPDVEGFRRVLAEHAAGVPIRKVDVHDRQVLHDTNAAALREALSGNRFAEPRRHGKWLIAGIDGDRRTVLIHFGMTGELVWTERDASAHRYDRVVFGFDSGDLRYRDMRKLKGLWLEPQSGVGEELSGLGPDACRVSREELAALLSRSRGGIKATLTDQAVVAGLGNLLGDEILWRARINPR
ncbi:DNA-formamidopyrimidine glycosylase family protein [Saccharomonospora sp. NPDC006951]